MTMDDHHSSKLDEENAKGGVGMDDHPEQHEDEQEESPVSSSVRFTDNSKKETYNQDKKKKKTKRIRVIMRQSIWYWMNGHRDPVYTVYRLFPMALIGRIGNDACGSFWSRVPVVSWCGKLLPW